MSRSVNPQIHAWFNRGEAVAAILGDEEYFLPSVTYRQTHDRLLVLSQLATWAELHDTGQQAREAVLNAVKTASRRGDARVAVDILWTLLIMSDERENPLSDTLAAVEDELRTVLTEERILLPKDDEFSRLVSLVSKRLPGIL